MEPFKIESLMRWYSYDHEDKIVLTRSEVGYLLEQLGVKEK